MTEIESLSKALAERGYIVFCAFGMDAEIAYKAGDRTFITYDGVTVDQPVYIIRETDRKDFSEHLTACGRTDENCDPPFVTRLRYWRAGTD